MPMTCTICTHPQREAVEIALIERKPLRDLARGFGLSRAALSRHGREHLTRKLLAAAQARENAHGVFLLRRLESLYDRTSRIYNDQHKDDPALALRAIQRLESQLELASRFFAHSGAANAMLESERRLLREAVHKALEPFPEARLALASALEQVRPDAV